MDEKEDYNMPNTPDNIVKIVVFAIIGLIVVSSVALPILAGLGIENHTESNDGAKVTRMTQEKWDDITAKYDNPANVSMNITANTGIYIGGFINGEYKMEYLAHIEDFNPSYPVLVKYSFEPSEYISSSAEETLTYSPDTQKFTTTTRTQTISSSGTSFLMDDIDLDEISFWYQTPDGDRIINMGDMSINGEWIEGFRIDIGSIVVADLQQAKYYDGSIGDYGRTEYGSPSIERESHGDYSTIESLSYHGIACQYYIGPITYSYTENTLENTPIGTMIGVIPVLMIMGLVIFVVRQFNKSDR